MGVSDVRGGVDGERPRLRPRARPPAGRPRPSREPDLPQVNGGAPVRVPGGAATASLKAAVLRSGRCPPARTLSPVPVRPLVTGGADVPPTGPDRRAGSRGAFGAGARPVGAAARSAVAQRGDAQLAQAGAGPYGDRAERVRSRSQGPPPAASPVPHAAGGRAAGGSPGTGRRARRAAAAPCRAMVRDQISRPSRSRSARVLRSGGSSSSRLRNSATAAATARPSASAPGSPGTSRQPPRGAQHAAPRRAGDGRGQREPAVRVVDAVEELAADTVRSRDGAVSPSRSRAVRTAMTSKDGGRPNTARTPPPDWRRTAAARS